MRLPIALAAATLLSTGVSTDALARNVVLSWEAPAERTNGDPLPASEIAEFRIYALTSAGASRITEVPGTVQSITTPVVDNACQRFVATAVDTDGNESLQSNEVTVCTYGPKPPKGFTVQLIK